MRSMFGGRLTNPYANSPSRQRTATQDLAGPDSVLAQAVAIRLFPVKSSAPATTPQHGEHSVFRLRSSKLDVRICRIRLPDRPIRSTALGYVLLLLNRTQVV